MSRYFTVVVRLAPGDNAKTLLDTIDTIPGVRLSAAGWYHAFDELDKYRLAKDETVYRSPV